MFYQTERFFNLTSNKPCIHEAKCFIKMLVDDGLFYHLADEAADRLSETAASEELIKNIQNYVNKVVFHDDIDWGPHECPHGYALFYADVLQKRNEAYKRGFAND
tara:strand:- start:108 stop:422 length:315 start_codon:yes stop_codon:yes gene_type:complete